EVFCQEVPAPLLFDPLSAALAHAVAQGRVGEEGDDAVGGGFRGGAGDDPAGLAVEDGVGGSARVAGDDGQAGRGRLQVDDAEPLHVQSPAPGAAGHREDVARAVVGGQLGPGDGAGEADRGGDPGVAGQPAQVVLVGAAADDQEHRVGLGG